MNKSIGVVGAGFVGGSLAQVFAERGLTVYSYDISGKRPHGCHWPTSCDKSNVVDGQLINVDSTLFLPKLEVFPSSFGEYVIACESDTKFERVYFVCLPTPMQEDGSCDLSIIDGVLAQLANIPGERIAVIKSTVPPGFTQKWNEKYSSQDLHIIHSPEFLRESTCLDDSRNQDRIILGGPRPWIDTVRDVFRTAFPTVPIFKTSSSNSEMTKYVINTFLSMKVLFANEMYELCGALHDRGEDIDYDRVIELATLDKRLGTSHWQVPGPMPADDGSGKLLKGIGGSCFIKDLNALIAVGKDLLVKTEMLCATWTKNLRVRPERDWEKLVGRAVSKKS